MRVTSARVRIRFVTPEEGGRTTAPTSGYRAPVWFGEIDGDGEPLLWDCHFDFAHDPALGSDTEAVMRSATAPARAMRSGTSFEVREGAHTVASGDVLGESEP
jgi:hypothetical protein